MQYEFHSSKFLFHFIITSDIADFGGSHCFTDRKSAVIELRVNPTDSKSLNHLFNYHR